MEFSDTHCHLNFEPLCNDLKGVLERARQQGVLNMLVPAVDLQSSIQVIKICELHPYLFAAIGVHPNSSLDWKNADRAEFRKLAQHDKVKAIGEIGLDYFRDRVPYDHQRMVFQEMLDLATESGLPVVIHNRDATQETLPMLWAWQKALKEEDHPLAQLPGVLHAFDGNPDTAREAIRRGFFLGVSGPVTYPNAQDLQAAVSAIPLDRMLLETDAPFLTPQPYRGKPNQPAYLPRVAERVSELQGSPLAAVAKATTRNAASLFGWSAPD